MIGSTLFLARGLLARSARVRTIRDPHPVNTMRCRFIVALACLSIATLSVSRPSPAAADEPAQKKPPAGAAAAGDEPSRDGHTLTEWIAMLKETKTRAEAIKALGKFGAVAVPPLMMEATAKNSYYRPDAIEALAAIGAPGVDAFIKAARASVAAQPAAQYALIKAGRPAVPALIRLLKERDDGMRLFAAFTIARMGPVAEDAAPALIAILKNKPAKQAAAPDDKQKGGSDSGMNIFQMHAESRPIFAFALGAIGPKAKAGVPTLIDASKEPIPMRLAAIDALGKIGPSAEAAVPQLIRFLSDPDFPVRLRSEAALALIGAPAAKPAVPKLLQLYKAEPIEEWRESAGEALKKIDPQVAARSGIK